MVNYNVITLTDESTVVAEYTADHPRSDSYQSEAELEREFVRLLSGQGYEFVNITDEAALITNLRQQLEVLNNITFSNDEWMRFFNETIASTNENIVDKTRKIQDDHVQILRRDDGSTKNIYLLDKKNIHNNRLQVINQYEESGGVHNTRYDVTILVNGLPLVHVELKRRGVAIREAFNQIKRYQRDSFWAASGLYEYIQIFVISNGTNTKYYSNTTRNAHIKEQGDGERRKSKKTSNSFEFTSYWADANNHVIADLVDFTKMFFAKHTLLNILTKFCVFTSEELLLVMRPYQIAATERILNRILCATNYKKTGTLDAGGYIWHTTGSGKTLTSFKTAQLATAIDSVDKVLFIVDRKDLDYQTIKEYDRFEKGAASGSKSTKQLEKNLNDPNTRIIIATIQKLDMFISRNKSHDIYKKRVVLIFDECHRSQFGEMHQKIVKAFRNYHIFGFTGTPIFSVNATTGGKPIMKTTPQAFGDKLHTYTIVDAINDGNVLPFRIDFINTVKQKEDVTDKNVRAIDVEKAMSAPERVREVVAYIIEHFDQKTKRNTFYSLKGQRTAGFNSMFAVASIPMAIKYYEEFKTQLAQKNKDLTIATIFSYSANESDPEDVLDSEFSLRENSSASRPASSGFIDEEFENEKLDQSSRDFLDAAIADYNGKFSTNFDTSADKFQNYYKDLSQRVKNREIDLLIVVNMFLTGFDATTLNTLWVDKNLKMHGLIQAYSRTNRILNSVKTFGNIVCFRDLKKATDDAISLFGNKEAGGIVLLKTYNEYYHGFDHKGKYQKGYEEMIAELLSKFSFSEDAPPLGEEARKEFIRLYGAILRLKNILTAFDDFAGNEILTDRDFQDYQSAYIDLYQDMRGKSDSDKENINDDVVFELELIKQIEVNIDYILMLVEKYHAGNCEDKTILASILKAINSSIELRSKKELIERFVEQVNVSVADMDWQSFVQARKEEDLTALIADAKLKDEEARRFMEIAFRDGALKTTGTDIDKIMPPTSRFGGGNRTAVKQGIIEKLMKFFEKYAGLV
ncbi:MAG: type I restriction endonuclease subunit R [Defluviitaleaceae bacterium]|nr:type I restriction endonuclease subunit R [Defluviitaleaceae bacterium]